MPLFQRLKDCWKVLFRGDANLSLLKRRGMQVGENLQLLGECRIDTSHAWLITIGDNVTIAPRVNILAHDASTKKYLGYTKIGLVTIEDGVFIGADSLILPGVSIGKGSIVGGGAVVSRDIPSGVVAAGAPAKPICTIEDFVSRNKAAMSDVPAFEDEYTIAGGISEAMKTEMISALRQHGGMGFVR